MLGSNVNVIFYFASTNSIFEKPLIQKLPDLSNIYILRKSSLIWTNQMLSNSCLIPKCPAGTLAVTSTGSDFCAFLYEIFLSFKHKSIGDFFFSFFLMFEPKASSVLAFGLYLLCPWSETQESYFKKVNMKEKTKTVHDIPPKQKLNHSLAALIQGHAWQTMSLEVFTSGDLSQAQSIKSRSSRWAPLFQSSMFLSWDPHSQPLNNDEGCIGGKW